MSEYLVEYDTVECCPCCEGDDWLCNQCGGCGMVSAGVGYMMVQGPLPAGCRRCAVHPISGLPIPQEQVLL